MNGPFIGKMDVTSYLFERGARLQNQTAMRKKKIFLSMFFFLASVFSFLLFFPPFASCFVCPCIRDLAAQDRKVGSFRGLLASLSKVRVGGEGRMPSLCALCLGKGFSVFLFLSLSVWDKPDILFSKENTTFVIPYFIFSDYYKYKDSIPE